MIITDDNGTTVTVNAVCPFCNEPSQVKNVPRKELYKWMLRTGPFIQDALPMLTDGERETIISGSHEKCFDEAFAEEEE